MDSAHVVSEPPTTRLLDQFKFAKQIYVTWIYVEYYVIQTQLELNLN